MEERRDEGAGELADQLEQDAERMRNRREELDSDIEGAKRDWESRQSDASIPGAQEAESLPDEMTDRDSGELDPLAADEGESDESEQAGDGSEESAEEDGESE